MGMLRKESMSADPAARTGSRLRANTSSMNQDRPQCDYSQGKDAPRLAGDSTDRRSDQDPGKIQTVEPLAGSHAIPFVRSS